MVLLAANPLTVSSSGMAELSLTTVRLYTKMKACVCVCVFGWEVRVGFGGCLPSQKAQFKCDLNKGAALPNDNRSSLFCVCCIRMCLV